NFWIDSRTGNQYFVGVQYEEDPNFKLNDVLDIVATGTRQESPVKLGSLVEEIRQDVAPVEVNHVSLARVFDVMVNTEGRDIGGVARGVQKKLDQLHTEIVGLIAQLKAEQTTLAGSKSPEARQRLPKLEKELTYLDALANLR